MNGKKVPDFAVWFRTDVGPVEADSLVGDVRRQYRWTPQVMTIDRLLWGTREELAAKQMIGEGAGEARLLADMAGDWSCLLRHDGQVVRTFAFRVDPNGRIAPSAAQSAPGFPRLAPGVVHVDLRLPAKNGYDQRVRPQAIKASMSYGMPWPKHPLLDAFRGSLPPPSGLPDPGRK